jgi:hypothetical protein
MQGRSLKPSAYRSVSSVKATGTGTNAEVIAKAFIDQACGGEVAAIRDVADRLEGKPRQAVEINGQPTDLAAHLRIHGLTIEDAEREAEEVLDGLHNLGLDTHEIN